MDGTPVSAGIAPLRERRWIGHARHDGIARPYRMERGTSLRERSIVASASKMIELDGSVGEGGGQILRSALSLSMITGKPFRLVRIRANRDKPGLRPQHLAAVEASAGLCGAEVRGADAGSRELTFRPGPIVARDFHHHIGTAGSTALVLQTLHLPIALHADRPIRVAIKGGTFNTSAPSFPFLDECWRLHLKSMGLPITLNMIDAGFFPKGGGKIEAWIEPGKPSPIQRLDRGSLMKIWGTAGVSRLPSGIASRMRSEAVSMLAERGFEAEIGMVEWPGASPGAAISLSVEHEGGNISTFVGLGERGKSAEAVAAGAVAELLAYEDANGAIDPHSADQILLPLAFAEGRSEFTVAEVTEHLRTNVRTIRAFIDRPIQVIEADDDGPGRVIVS